MKALLSLVALLAAATLASAPATAQGHGGGHSGGHGGGHSSGHGGGHVGSHGFGGHGPISHGGHGISGHPAPTAPHHGGAVGHAGNGHTGWPGAQHQDRHWALYRHRSYLWDTCAWASPIYGYGCGFPYAYGSAPSYVNARLGPDQVSEEEETDDEPEAGGSLLVRPILWDEAVPWDADE